MAEALIVNTTVRTLGLYHRNWKGEEAEQAKLLAWLLAVVLKMDATSRMFDLKENFLKRLELPNLKIGNEGAKALSKALKPTLL